ncbi:hypothetical protein AB0M39_33065 [Streptomyces sp. NPDC051907]|uniref:hypothetical protein n=1 Tax=Streptomyces sp. NPDC051907 TaxID=3155284 RepID=UPI003449922E
MAQAKAQAHGRAQQEEPRIDVEPGPWAGGTALNTAQSAELCGKLPKGPWLGMPLRGSGEPPRRPDAEWELTGSRPYLGRFATGRAAVYLSPSHTALTRPMIFADGFGHGRSDLPALWDHFNRPYGDSGQRFLDQLLGMGVDVILLGFDARHTYVQANAGVAISCIERAKDERRGARPLIVGGVSTGGLITRYALAELESVGVDHQTETYLSYDTPHNGAWTPLILQQLAHFFDAVLQPPEGGARQSQLLRSAAAQQLLWGWAESAEYSGPLATASPLRRQLLADLRDVGGFPSRPLKLGVANGTGDGLGRELTPGRTAFEWEWPGVASAAAVIQPDRGRRMEVGHMAAGGNQVRSFTSGVPPFDGAPGGTLKTFGLLAEALQTPIAEAYRRSCFVPSSSAVALDADEHGWPSDLYARLEALSPGRFALHDFACDGENTEHGSVSAPLVEWILARLAK